MAFVFSLNGLLINSKKKSEFQTPLGTNNFAKEKNIVSFYLYIKFTTAIIFFIDINYLSIEISHHSNHIKISYIICL
jgi:hypothetical protein